MAATQCVILLTSHITKLLYTQLRESVTLRGVFILIWTSKIEIFHEIFCSMYELQHVNDIIKFALCFYVNSRLTETCVSRGGFTVQNTICAWTKNSLVIQPADQT